MKPVVDVVARGSFLLVGIGLLGSMTSACSVTNGSGELHGQLNVPACSFKDGKPVPIPTDDDGVYRKPLNFFSGEPYDSTSARFPANQLNIRAQNGSARAEFADFLQIWILDSSEVARCVLGHMNPDGTGDWDERYCDRSPEALASGGGQGHLYIGTENEIITGSYVLYQSCTDLSAAMALGKCQGDTCPDLTVCPGRGSWISFSKFGNPVLNKEGHVDRGFKVADDAKIESPALHLELCDKSTVDQMKTGILPIPVPQISGTLDGSFQFDLRQDLR